MSENIHKYSPKSSNVEELIYNYDSEVLVIVYKGNRRYVYECISPTVYKALVEAESVGKFINANIVDIYPVSKVESLGG